MSSTEYIKLNGESFRCLFRHRNNGIIISYSEYHWCGNCDPRVTWIGVFSKGTFHDLASWVLRGCHHRPRVWGKPIGYEMLQSGTKTHVLNCQEGKTTFSCVLTADRSRLQTASLRNIQQQVFIKAATICIVGV